MNKALALVAALAIMSLSAAADAAVTLNSVRIVAHIELIQQPAR